MEENGTPAAVSVLDFLRDIDAHTVPHARGRSLYDHLAGTCAILRAWSQPSWLCDAGALHSIYGTEAYQTRLVSTRRREEVKAVAGEQAERLAYLFCVVGRSRLMLLAREPQRLTDSQLGGIWISREDLASLLLLYMANAAEQAAGPDGSPAPYLWRLSRWGLCAGRLPGSVPPIFERCTRSISAAQEKAAVDAYTSGLAAMAKDRPGSLRQMRRAADMCPWVAEPHVWLGYLALQTGAYADAELASSHAREICRDWGTAWDKRLPLDDWLYLIDFIAAQAAKPEIVPLPAPLPSTLVPFLATLRHRKWRTVSLGSTPRTDPGETGTPRFNRYIASLADGDPALRAKTYPGLRPQAWYDSQQFPLARALESNFTEIRREILALEDSRFARESEAIPRTGKWATMYFHERGRRNDEVCAVCPLTSRIIGEHRTIRTLAGLAYVSRLHGGAHVAPHYGPTNLRLRCHLGVRIPSGNCGIRVDDEIRQWADGKCLVFNDVFLHDAWNHTADDRTVLIVDLWHPELSDDEIKLLVALHGYAAAQAVSLNAYFTANRTARSSGAE